MNASDDRDRRRAELEAKSEHTDAEFAELIRLSEPGKFIKLPNLRTAGLKDLNQALQNFATVGDRSKRAFENGFFVEVLALRSQSLELFLRIYLAGKLGMTPSFPVDDRKTLGALITEAEKAGLDTSVVDGLRAFNTARITGVHHYLLGSSSYEALGELCNGSKDLMATLVNAIARELGRPEGI